jgi:hypothetical protein
MTGRKIITIAVILTLVSFVVLSNNSQTSFAKTTKDKSKTDSQTSSSSQTKDKSKTDSQTSSSSQSLSSANTSSDLDKMQFQQFGTCLGISAGKDSFATEKEVKNCFLIVYNSEPSSSSSTTSSSGSK